jgi:hypothetical protein
LLIRRNRELQFSLASSVWARTMDNGNFAAIADWFTTYFFWAGAACLLVFDLAADVDDGIRTAMRVAAFGLLFASASTAVGWLFGLLFGIPRSLSRPQPTQDGAVSPVAQAGHAVPVASGSPQGNTPSRVNTNLEDISDWLTKTIVGIGLTQLYTAPAFIWHVARVLNDTGPGWTGHGQAFVLMILIYYSVGGFWLGYVGTRTILTKLFDFVDGARINPAQVAAARDPSNLRLDLSATAIAPTLDPAVVKADEVLLKTPRDAVRSIAGLTAWGAAHARARNWGTATSALETVSRLLPDDDGVKQQLATIYTAAGRPQDSEAVLEGALPNEVGLANTLAEGTPDGAAKAVQTGEAMLSDPAQAGNARLHVGLARAYGQQHAFQTAQKGSPADLAAIRDKVVREITAALKADPGAKALLLSLWKSGGGRARADLASLDPNDPDLTKLLG